MAQDEKQCAYCHAILFSDDDVVYCPECGAPHHRECYAKAGHCARIEYHGTAEPEPDKPADDEKAPEQQRPSGVPLDREGHTCPRCGQMSTSDTLFCPYCGTPFGDNAKANDGRPPYTMPYGFNVPATTLDPYGGVDPSASIGDIPVTEYTSFVRTGTRHYIPRFKVLSERKERADWNWSAAIFSYGWLFFRKCYREGLVAILFTLISYILIAPYYVSVYAYMYANSITTDMLISGSESASIVSDMLASVGTPVWIMLAAGLVVNLIIHIMVGLFGNSLYFRRCGIRIRGIKADDRFEDKAGTISMAGGTNYLSAALIVYCMIYVVFNLIMNLIY